MSLLCQISHNDVNAVQVLGKEIKSRLTRNEPYSELVILCIGTDRCTGDALGPLVGSFLQEVNPPGCDIWGTLETPIHALNLHKAVQKLNTLSNPLILSIDACLGQLNHIGDVQVVNGPLRPGMGVKKVLPAVGHFHVKGIVNTSGFLEAMVLQNTRLNTVMSMAKVITKAILLALD